QRQVERRTRRYMQLVARGFDSLRRSANHGIWLGGRGDQDRVFARRKLLESHFAGTINGPDGYNALPRVLQSDRELLREWVSPRKLYRQFRGTCRFADGFVQFLTISGQVHLSRLLDLACFWFMSTDCVIGISNA